MPFFYRNFTVFVVSTLFFCVACSNEESSQKTKPEATKREPHNNPIKKLYNSLSDDGTPRSPVVIREKEVIVKNPTPYPKPPIKTNQRERDYDREYNRLKPLIDEALNLDNATR